jgi:hypothetical protein
MSKDSGKVERQIGALIMATEDRALSITDLARHAFGLDPDATPSRKQRLSATRAAHRLLRRAAPATDAVETTLHRVIAETTAELRREPGGRGRGETVYVLAGARHVAVDEAFYAAMKTAPGWLSLQQALADAETGKATLRQCSGR